MTLETVTPDIPGSASGTISVTIEISLRQIADWMVAALEGGSNYWLDSFTLDYGAYPNDRPDDGRWYDDPAQWSCDALRVSFKTQEDEDFDGTLTPENIREGIRLLAAKRMRTFARLAEPDGVRWDANDADIFLQLCCFGDIVYG